MGMTNKEARKILKEHTRNYVPLIDEKALETAIKALGNCSPCDLCVHNPPSSFGGKPCTMCPAQPKVCEEE